MKASDPPVIVEQYFDHTKEKIWGALTDHPQMIQWFFSDIPAFDPKEGFETVFNVESGERVFPHHWKLLEVIPNVKIVYDWHYGDAWKGRGTVMFEIIPQGDGNIVRLTNHVVEDFEANIPEFKRESCIGGWNYFIKEQLNQFLTQ